MLLQKETKGEDIMMACRAMKVVAMEFFPVAMGFFFVNNGWRFHHRYYVDDDNNCSFLHAFCFFHYEIFALLDNDVISNSGRMYWVM